MQDITSLWVRVELTPDTRVSSYQMFSDSQLEHGELTSTSIGTVYVSPPKRATELPRCIADPLTIVIMHGGEVEDVGAMLTGGRWRSLGTAAWLYDVSMNYTTLYEIAKEQSWVKSTATIQSRAMNELLDRLRGSERERMWGSV